MEVSARSAKAKTVSSGYLPTLDGWRAIAIIAVIFHHSALLHVGRFTTAWLYDFGSIGVQVFFAISGILICSRLLEEEARTGKLNLKGFYIRRTLRIQPAALLYLAAVLVLKLWGRIALSWTGFFAALTLLRNYLPYHATPEIDFATLHFWSLSVEEHFYLLLPAFLLFVKRGRVVWLLLASCLVVLWSNYVVHHNLLVPLSYHHTDLILPALLVPAAIAVQLRHPGFRLRVKRFLTPLSGLVIATLIDLPIIIGMPHIPRSLGFVAPAILVIATVLHPESIISRFLELPPLRFVGRISYGLYLWQELFFTGHFAPSMRPFGVLGDFPWNLLVVFLLATASYYLVELPCMRMGHRLAKPAVEGRPELAAATSAAP